MTDPVRAHERRLRATFGRLLVLALAPSAALQACSDDTVVGAVGADAGDATVGEDVRPPDGPSADDEAAFLDVADATREASQGDASADAADAEASETTDATSDAPTSDDGATDAEGDGSSQWCAEASAGTPWWPDASGNCRYYVELSCAQFAPVGGCLLSGADCLKVCTLNTPLFDCAYAQPACTIAGRFVAEAGQPVPVECDLCPGAGRRPAGLRRRTSRRARSALGEYFAQAAYLETASVCAFERVARELRAHLAPAGLVSAARRSARDEVRHARIMREFAARHGASVVQPAVAPSRIRSLEEMARENAVEGCVRETYGALIATWQASRALDPAVRRSFSGIAADETRHAALAWAIAEWANGFLDAAARRRVSRARRDAAGRLRAEIARELPRELEARVGLPSMREALVLFEGLGE